MKKAILCAVVLFAVSTSFAEFITHSGSISAMPANNFSQSFDVPLFNSSLGTLDSIQIEFTVTTSGTISATNVGTGYDTFSIDFWQLTSIVLPDDSYGSVISDPPTNYGTYSVAPNQTVVYTVEPFSGNFTTTVSSEHFRNLLTGTGNGTFWFDGGISSSWIATNHNPYDVALALNTAMDWTVEYTYTVPEPMTLLILGLGCILLRRK
ncbi:MAG: choice-of-anchor E domain-containing protein [Phycisphaerales bacterium]